MKKVVLIGDSIRQGYEKYVRLALDGVAEVYSPQDCCRFASYVLRYVANWKGEVGCGSDVDVVHWNAGLWDCLHMVDGKPHTPVDEYKAYLARIHAVLCTIFPNAKQIFATSTAVLEERYTGVYVRFNREIEEYNAAAIEVLTPLGVQINDLYGLTAGIDEIHYSDMTHFNTKEGAQLLTQRVAGCIAGVLDTTAKELDYDALFAKQTHIVGI